MAPEGSASTVWAHSRCLKSLGPLPRHPPQLSGIRDASLGRGDLQFCGPSLSPIPHCPQSLQIAAFLFTVCHVVIVVQDWFTDLSLYR